MEKLTPAQLELIKKPLPPEAVKPHPTKTYLSSIKAIYVTERLNEVFWVGVWQIRVRKEEAGENGMIVIHTIFEVPSYWIYYECFGGNDNWGETSKNFDLWDAYKWATTDAITKIASWIGIWIDVFKGKWNTPQKSEALGWAVVKWMNFSDLKKCIASWTDTEELLTQYIIDNEFKLSQAMKTCLRHYCDKGELIEPDYKK